MKGFFGRGVTCIYIDQFAASNLFDEPPNELWSEIALILVEKFTMGKIVCPVPPEHFLESSRKLKDRAVKVDKKLHEFSRGLAFLPEAISAANCMIALLRNQPFSMQTFIAPLKYNNTINQTDAFEGFRGQYNDLEAKVSESASVANEFRSSLAEKRFSRKVLEPMYEAIKWVQVRKFSERLAELIYTGYTVSRGIKFDTGSVIDWPDLLLQLLLWQHKMTSFEGKKLFDLLMETGFSDIPSLDIRTSLTANISVENKKEMINDHVDIMRLSSGLPAADILFADKQRKFELQQTGLDKKYKAKIFCGTVADLTLFRENLKAM